MSPIRHALAVALCAIAIWVAANLAIAVVGRVARLDVSVDQFASLSAPVDEAVQNLAEPVRLVFVFSRDAARDHPALEGHGLRVREYLRQLAARSDGLVRLAEIDPRAGAPPAALAAVEGLSPLETGPRGPVHLALYGYNAVDERKDAPALRPDREAALERDVAGLLAALETAPKVVAASNAVAPRAVPDRRLAYARLPVEAQAPAREREQRLVLLIHALLAPLAVLGAGLLVRRWRASMGEARP